MKVNNRWLYCGLNCLTLMLLVTSASSMECQEEEDQEFVLIDPEQPIITFLGVSGTGKSAFGNMLNRIENVDNKDIFTEGKALESETKWPKHCSIVDFEGNSIAVIDNPGLKDSNGRDNKIRHGVVSFIEKQKSRNPEFGVNAFVMFINAENVRFDDSTQDALLDYVKMFDESFLDNMVVVVRSWPYSQEIIQDIENSKDTEKQPHGQAGMQKTQIAITDKIVECLRRASDDKSNDVVIPDERIEHIKENRIPCFFVDAFYNKKDDDNDEFFYSDDEQDQVRQQVKMFLEHVKKTKKCPCEKFNNDVQDHKTQAEADLQNKTEKLNKADDCGKKAKAAAAAEIASEREADKASEMKRLRAIAQINSWIDCVKDGACNNRYKWMITSEKALIKIRRQVANGELEPEEARRMCKEAVAESLIGFDMYLYEYYHVTVREFDIHIDSCMENHSDFMGKDY